MRKTKFGRSVLTVILTIIMVFEMIVPALTAFAADSYTYKGGAGTKVSDLDTSTKYSESLGDNASTEYAGRIWTDKSVYTDDVVFATYGGGESEIKLNENKNGEDFLVAYSALATSQSVSGQTQAPVDVVFIIDISGSMSNSDSEMDNGLSRIANTVSAVNNSIEKLMLMNEYTRISVVTFSSTAQVLLPLDRYSKMTYWGTTYNYLSLNSTEAGGNVQLYARAIGEENGNINTTRNVSGGTNIQMGLYQGMNVLASETDIYADINGQRVKRTPSVVLLSDGAPTYSSDSNSWWNPENNNDDGPGNSPYYGNGFKALLTGAYMKNAIDENYKIDGTSYSTTFYTIGMGISEIDNYDYYGFNRYYTGEQDLAYFTLNPKAYWTASNDMSEDMVDAWTTYTNHTPNTNNTFSVKTGSNENYTVIHPQSPLSDIYTSNDKDALKNLVDSYYDADNHSAINEVFNQIVSNISITAPQVPTEIKGTDPMNDGYITYTDPIGEYMEVKDVKAIIYAGTTFTVKEKTVYGNITTYTFSGIIDSAVYGHQEIKNILITVEETDGKQTLVIKIPASVIPLRVNEVTLNADGSVKSHTNNGAFPARVIYSVGLQSGIVKESDDGTVYINRSKISADYLSANTNADGTINFYSNIYSNSKSVNGATAGDATVEFEPSHSNGFYYILEDMPIYKDAEFKNQVVSTGNLDNDLKDDTVYYYNDEYYHGSSVESDAIQRTGAQLKKTDIKVGTDGYLYRAEGSPRLNRILRFEGTKVLNKTETAEDFYAPTFEYAVGSTDAYDGKFVIYQGNNGVLSVIGGGNLQISKRVIAGIGITAPDKSFEFTIDLDGNEVNQGTYDYIIVNAEGETVETGFVSKNDPKINLKDGQTATIQGLLPKTTYSVTEASVEGFTKQSEGESGTINAGETSIASFTNTYNVTPVSYPADGGLKGTKILERPGNEWTADDVYAFYIFPYNNAPLPDAYDADKGVVVNGPDAVGSNIATFNFGSIKFTAPGIYRYTVTEKEPENDEYLPGISYSRALYRIVVTVVDNGNGTLSIASNDIQKLYDDDANQLFTYNNDNEIVMNQGQEAQDDIVFVNSYSAESVTRVPVALKDYTDNSGQNPLVSGMFEFKLEALGIVDEQNDGNIQDDPIKSNTVSSVPMPEGSTNGTIKTTNEGHNVTFPSVTFTQNDIPDNKSSVVFRYRMSEVTPANPVSGMKYDSNTYDINVIVSVDPNSHILNVEAIYPDNNSIAIFKNEYTPTPVTADINGSKTLYGRDMKQGEAFEFVLSSNPSTGNAIRNGIVVVPSGTDTVSNATDGNATPFAFKDIQFKKAGTYIFTVSETKGNAPAVQYDDSVVTVTIVIDDTDKDSSLEVISITYSNGNNLAEFVNTYTAEFDGEPINLKGTKTLTGKSLFAGEFYFNVVEYFNGQKVTEGLVTHTADTEPDVNDRYQGSITLLKDVTYSTAGEYSYYITEQIPSPKVGGTTYDESTFRYIVTVEDVKKEGKLTVTSTVLQKLNGNIWETAPNVEFINTYIPAPTTTAIPVINKIIAGDRKDGLKAGEFEFEIKEVSDPDNGMTLPSSSVVSNDADGKINFGDITFTKAGLYTVSVNEVIPDDANKLPGITYTTQVITATFSVVDDRNGTLTATLIEYSSDAFINEYKAEPAEVNIDIKKNFTGRLNNEWLDTDKFDFEVVVLDPDTAKAITNGDIEFPLDNSNHEISKKTINKDTPNKTVSGTVKVNNPGVYKFIVRELTGNIPGIHYDSKPREIIIEASDDSDNAKIITKVSVNGHETNDLTLTFENKYDAKSTELSGHDNLTIEKIFTGRENDQWLDTDEFKFTLEAADNDTTNAINSGKIEMPDSELYVSNANKAHPHFGNIIFHEIGTYKFVVKEVNNNIPGVTYDADDERKITVNVSDNGDGTLVASIDASSDSLTFTNTYSATEVTLDGSTKLKITKSLIGRKWFGDDEFKFAIRPFGNATLNAISANEVIMPALTEITIDAQNGFTGSIDAHFGDITFNKPGIYNFIITETEGNIDNILYDSHSYEVLVTVTDNNNGALVATPDYYGSSVFENKYSPDPVDIELKGEKELKGNRKLFAGDFEFTVTPVTVGAPIPERIRVSNDADGNVDFGKAEFNSVGTYEYEIRETHGIIKGVTYDEKKVTATVTVTYDDSTGKLKAEVSYVKEGESSSNTFTFKNTHKAEASEPIALTAEKKVTANEGNSFTMKGGEFSFVIEGSQNAPMPDKTTVTNNANGSIDFGSVIFTEKGTYYYTVHEVQGNLPYFSYDSEVYTITVEVEDDTDNAKMITTVKVTNKNSQETEAIFKNKYTPKETSALIFGNKKLEGGHKDLEADEFEFSIKAKTQNAPMPSKTTVKNTATGLFQFDTITYTKVGTYVYEITEKDLDKDGYTYDDSTYNVTVTVTDEGKGQLTAVVDGVGTSQKPTIKFVNKYVPSPVDIVLGEEGELTKELDGRDIKDKEFVFAVLDSEDNEIATAKNNKKGKFEFELNFTKADTYKYSIVEVNNSVAGVTYDEKVYGVEIVVVDKNGHLKVESVKYSLENKNVDEVVFNNTYKADETDIIISATKKLTGRDLKDGEFKFILKDENGKVIGTATNSKDGKIVFDKVIIKEKGEYKFTVAEEKGNLENVTYDKTEYIVEIEVKDEGKGKLVASEPVIKKEGTKNAVSEIVFENTYTAPLPVPTPTPAPESPKTGDTTNLSSWFALMFISGGCLFGTAIYGIKRIRKTK